MTTDRGHVVQKVLTPPDTARVQVSFRRFGRTDRRALARFGPMAIRRGGKTAIELFLVCRLSHATAASLRVLRCSTPGPGPGQSSSASGCLPLVQAMPSRRLSEVGFQSCAPGNAGPSTFNGVRITSSPKGSWIITPRPIATPYRGRMI